MEYDLSDQRINEAFALLNEAAKDKRDELAKLVQEKYSNVRTIFEQSTAGGRQAANRAREGARQAWSQSQQKLRETAERADIAVHENPWAYIGGIAVGFGILGFMLGCRNQRLY